METTPPVRLYKKLHAVMAAVDRVAKKGRNSFFGYNYVTEGDVETVVRDAMIENGVLCMPSVVSCAIEEVKTTKGGTERIARLEMAYTWIDIESGESMETCFISEGQDPGEKGVYKAYSGGMKYALLKTFHIPTGDDPERDDRRPPMPPPRPAGPVVRQGVTTSTTTPVIRVQTGQKGDREAKPVPNGAEASAEDAPGAAAWSVAAGVQADKLQPSEAAVVTANKGWRNSCVTCQVAMVATGEAATIVMGGPAAARLGAARPDEKIWIRKDGDGKIVAYALVPTNAAKQAG